MSYGIAINTHQILLAGSDDGTLIELDNIIDQKHRFLMQGHDMEISSVIVNSRSVINSTTAELMVKLRETNSKITMADIDWVLTRIKDPDLTIVIVTDTAVFTFRWDYRLEEVERKSTDRGIDMMVIYEHATREQREGFELAVDNNSDNLLHAIGELEATELFGTFSVQVVC